LKLFRLSYLRFPAIPERIARQGEGQRLGSEGDSRRAPDTNPIAHPYEPAGCRARLHLAFGQVNEAKAGHLSET